MAPRPSSPTSLLWAHQLKREHNHLVGRIILLEAANQQLKEQIKVAEETNIVAISANEKISRLAARLDSIEKANNQIIQHLERLESSSADATQNAKSDIEILQKKVEVMETRQIEHESRLKEMQHRLSTLENANQDATGDTAQVERNTRIQTPELPSSGQTIHILVSPLKQRNSRQYVWTRFNGSCTVWID